MLNNVGHTAKHTKNRSTSGNGRCEFLLEVHKDMLGSIDTRYSVIDEWDLDTAILEFDAARHDRHLRSRLLAGHAVAVPTGDARPGQLHLHPRLRGQLLALGHEDETCFHAQSTLS